MTDRPPSIGLSPDEQTRVLKKFGVSTEQVGSATQRRHRSHCLVEQDNHGYLDHGRVRSWAGTFSR